MKLLALVILIILTYGSFFLYALVSLPYRTKKGHPERTTWEKVVNSFHYSLRIYTGTILVSVFMFFLFMGILWAVEVIFEW